MLKVGENSSKFDSGKGLSFSERASTMYTVGISLDGVSEISVAINSNVLTECDILSATLDGSSIRERSWL